MKEKKRSVMFMLFAAEEMGLQGSKYAAEKLKKDGIEPDAVLNIEMLSVPMEGRDYLAYVTGYETSNLAEKFNDYAAEEVLGYLPGLYPQRLY